MSIILGAFQHHIWMKSSKVSQNSKSCQALRGVSQTREIHKISLKQKMSSSTMMNKD